MSLQTETLKPCPFCGGVAVYEIDSDYNEFLGWISCSECWADGPTGAPGDHNKATAVERWNHRVLSDGYQGVKNE